MASIDPEHLTNPGSAPGWRTGRAHGRVQLWGGTLRDGDGPSGLAIVRNGGHHALFFLLVGRRIEFSRLDEGNQIIKTSKSR